MMLYRVLKEELLTRNNKAAASFIYDDGCNKGKGLMKTIGLLQEACILCNTLETSLFPTTISIITTSSTSIPILGASKRSIRSSRTTSEGPCFCPDEGLTTYTKVLAMDGTPIRPDLSQAEYVLFYLAVKSILCFNLGVCSLLLEDDVEEASMYFERTNSMLSSKKDIKCHLFKIMRSSEGENPSSSCLEIAIHHNQGFLHLRRGNLTEALVSYHKALNLATEFDGPMAMSVAAALNSIGVIYSHQSQMDKGMGMMALDHFFRSLSIRTSSRNQSEGKLLISDRIAATVLNNIGRVKFFQKDFEASLEYHSKSYAIRKFILGPDHFDTAVVAFNIGNCHRCLKKLENAYHYYYTNFAAPIMRRSSNFLSKEVVQAFVSIATDFHHDLRADYARTFYKLGIESAQMVFAENDAFLPHLFHTYGNFLFETGDLHGSLNSYMKGFALEEIIYPPGHSNLTITFSNIARTYELLGKFDQAIYAHEALKENLELGTADAAEEGHGQQNGIASALWSIAELQEKMNRLDQSLETLHQHLQHLRLRLQESPENMFLISRTLNRIGLLLLKRWEDGGLASIPYFEKSVKIRQEMNCSAECISIATCNLANAYHITDNSEQAFHAFETTLKLELSKAEEDHGKEFEPRLVLDIYIKMAGILHKTKCDTSGALEFYDKAISLCEKEGGTKLPPSIVSQTYAFAGNLYLEVGDMKKAMPLLTKSMRINRLIGQDDLTHINVHVYDFCKMLKNYPEAAAAA